MNVTTKPEKCSPEISKIFASSAFSVDIGSSLALVMRSPIRRNAPSAKAFFGRAVLFHFHSQLAIKSPSRPKRVREIEKRMNKDRRHVTAAPSS
jgi:hypothetical protein